MHLNRIIATALIISAFLICCGSDSVLAKPTFLPLPKSISISYANDSSDILYQLVSKREIKAKVALEKASVAAETSRQAELNRVPLYGHGPIWTFDDCEYETRGNVAHIVEILKAHHIERGRGIFFMNGDCYRSRPDLVSTIHGSGYVIGNHGTIHEFMIGMNQDRINWMIDGGPHETRLFRPPYGDPNHILSSRIAAEGFSEFLWTVDSGDTDRNVIRRSCVPILNWLRNQVQPDSIVLMHMFNRESARALNAYLSGGDC